MTEPPPKRSRLEEELLEILERADRPPLKPIALRSAADRAAWRARLRGRSWMTLLGSRARSGGWTVILAGMVAAIVGNVVVEPFSPLLARLLLYVAVVAIVLGFVQLYRDSSRGDGAKTWRGRPMDLNRRGRDLEDRFDQWRKRR